MSRRVLPAAPPASAPAAEWLHVDALKPWGRNPRRNVQVVSKLARAILDLGFGAPLVARRDTGGLVAGHTRRLAVLHLLAADPTFTIAGAPGPGFVPVRVMDLDDDRATKLALADNNRDLQGEWDNAALLAILGDYRQQGTDALASAGWDDAAVDALLAAAEPHGTPPADDQSDAARAGFAVVVQCDDEATQLRVIEHCQAEGWACRALT